MKKRIMEPPPASSTDKKIHDDEHDNEDISSDIEVIEDGHRGRSSNTKATTSEKFSTSSSNTKRNAKTKNSNDVKRAGRRTAAAHRAVKRRRGELNSDDSESMEDVEEYIEPDEKKPRRNEFSPEVNVLDISSDEDQIMEIADQDAQDSASYAKSPLDEPMSSLGSAKNVATKDKTLTFSTVNQPNGGKTTSVPAESLAATIELNQDGIRTSNTSLLPPQMPAAQITNLRMPLKQSLGKSTDIVTEGMDSLPTAHVNKEQMYVQLPPPSRRPNFGDQIGQKSHSQQQQLPSVLVRPSNQARSIPEIGENESFLEYPPPPSHLSVRAKYSILHKTWVWCFMLLCLHSVIMKYWYEHFLTHLIGVSVAAVNFYQNLLPENVPPLEIDINETLYFIETNTFEGLSIDGFEGEEDEEDDDEEDDHEEEVDVEVSSVAEIVLEPLPPPPPIIINKTIIEFVTIPNKERNETRNNLTIALDTLDKLMQPFTQNVEEVENEVVLLKAKVDGLRLLVDVASAKFQKEQHILRNDSLSDDVQAGVLASALQRIDDAAMGYFLDFDFLNDWVLPNITSCEDDNISDTTTLTLFSEDKLEISHDKLLSEVTTSTVDLFKEESVLDEVRVWLRDDLFSKSKNLLRKFKQKAPPSNVTALNSSDTNLESIKRSTILRLEIERADQTGRIDYASILNGASIIRYGDRSTSPSIVDNLPLLNRLSVHINNAFHGYGPEMALTPTHPPFALGQCWSFLKVDGNQYGDFATLSIRLARAIVIDTISIEHPSNDISNHVGSAIRSFRVFGFERSDAQGKDWPLGSFEYDTQGAIRQEFKIVDSVQGVYLPKFRSVSLAIDSNWGMEYTCVYRVRVHGK